MQTELSVSAATLLSFLLVLARMAGVFAFVPMPLKDAGPSMARIAIALGSTIALYPRWPVVETASISFAKLVALVVCDAALGASIGLMVSFLSEAFALGAQSLALQAGYGYASVVDPVTQADSDVLAVLAQLLAGLFFFTAGLHRFLIKALAESLDSFPPGAFSLTTGLAQSIIKLGSGIFAIGLRLAMPIVGLLLTAELALALLGRINSQLHLGIQAFPIKMLLALLCLTAILAVTPALYQSYASEVFRGIRHDILQPSH